MNPSACRTPSIQIDVRIDKDLALPGRVWCADRPRALVAIVHGLGEHSGGAPHPPLAGAHPALAALPIPDEGRRVSVPARHRVLQPGDQFLGTVRVLPG